MAQHPTPAEVREFLERYPDISSIDVLIADINGCQRGKRIRRDALPKIYEHGVCLPGSLYGMDITGATVEASGLGFDDGDADRLCWPLAGRLHPAPWQTPATGQVLMYMQEADGRPFFADPRHVLATVVELFRALGLTPVVAVELEFYLIDRKRDRDRRPQPPVSPITGERESSTQVYGVKEVDDYDRFFEDVARCCEAQGLPADTAVSEYAPGQYEVNLHHRPDALAACDDAFLLKRLIKGVARHHGMEATFMAKPYEDRAGSGLHLHASLIDGNGANIFAAESPLGSDALRQAAGGLIATMTEGAAIFAPTANSYRRYRVNNYVPMAAAWGANNRTLALRIPAGPPDSRRIEHRIAGADANPYTVAAAVLAGVHHGIASRLDPGPATEGNAYTQIQPVVPRYWNEALTLFDRAAILPTYLGADFCRVYSACRWHECETFNATVTPLEYEWYLRNV